MKTFIFDLDGVLVCTDKYHYIAWKKIADRLGIYFDEKINNRLRGVSRMASLDIILERSTRRYSREEKEELAEEKNNYYKEMLEHMIPDDVEPSVRKTLAELKLRGHKLVVGSSSKNAKFILRQSKLIDIFDAVSDGNNIVRSKPYPDVFLKAAEFVKDDADNCVVVEDSVVGIEAAKAAGMLTVGLGEAKNYAKTDFAIEQFTDILRISM